MDVYFRIILLPDEKIYKEIAELDERISKKYDIQIEPKYKKVPPHISFLFLSKNINIQDTTDIIKQLKKGCMQIEPFKIKIDGFGYFMKKPNFPTYLIYLRVIKNRSLSKLYRLVNLYTKNHEKVEFAEFIPHITLIGSGPSRKKFLKIKNECQNIEFKRSFVAKGVFVGIQKNEEDDCKLTELRFHYK